MLADIYFVIGIFLTPILTYLMVLVFKQYTLPPLIVFILVNVPEIIFPTFGDGFPPFIRSLLLTGISSGTSFVLWMVETHRGKKDMKL
jgi:hypothetical protein